MRLAASGRGLRRLQPRQRLRACAPLLRPRPCCAHRSSSSSAAAGAPDGEEGAAFAVDEHFPPELAGFSSQEQYRAVVKVFNVHSTPNYLMPWTNKPHRDSTGSGFCIEGRRIITNAHVVADTTHCQVRKHGEAIKFTARVVGISHECDLAMLAVEDEAFWAEVAPLPLGDIPELQDGVTVVGYPTGGDNISVTGGVVSRVDFQQYAHGAANLLAVQIDAAINPGNSGVRAQPSWPSRASSLPTKSCCAGAGDAERRGGGRGLPESHRRGEHRLHHPDQRRAALPRRHCPAWGLRFSHARRALPAAGLAFAADVPGAGPLPGVRRGGGAGEQGAADLLCGPGAAAAGRAAAIQRRDGQILPRFFPVFPRFFPIFPPFLDRLDATARSISVAKSGRRSTGW